MKFFTINAKQEKSLLRRESMDGRSYLVAPVVMLTEGVHNGSNGPVFYSAEEIAKFPASWNMKPLVIYHPVANDGSSISACTPDVIEAQGVGIIMNTSFDDKLRAEAWFDEQKLATVDNRVLEALNEGTLIEVSTGLFTDTLEGEGVWNEEAYKYTATNFKPDHLAILFDKKGACSIADGAGLLQTNAEGLKTNELSYDDTRRQLSSLLNGAGWVVDVYDAWFVYSSRFDDKLYRMRYTKTNDVVSLSSEQPAEVYAQTTYRLRLDGSLIGNASQSPVFYVHNSEGRFVMSMTADQRKAAIDALIANAKTPWEETHRGFLLTQNDDFLSKAAELPAPATEKPEDVLKTNQQLVTNSTQAKAQTVQEYVAQAPSQIQLVLNRGLQAIEAERQTAIQIITNAPGAQLTAEQLGSWPDDQLFAFARQVHNMQQQVTPTANNNEVVSNSNYVGLGLGNGSLINNNTPATNQGGRGLDMLYTL